MSPRCPSTCLPSVASVAAGSRGARGGRTGGRGRSAYQAALDRERYGSRAPPAVIRRWR